MDTVDSKTRSRIMAAIRGKDTKPELLVRSLLHRAGFRFRLHASELPGRPDIVLPKHGAVIQVHGCFWHGHDCPRFKMPKTRRRFWSDKIGTNRKRDQKNKLELIELGWRVAVVWECALAGKSTTAQQRVSRRLVRWILSDQEKTVISSRKSILMKKDQTNEIKGLSPFNSQFRSMPTKD